MGISRDSQSICLNHALIQRNARNNSTGVFNLEKDNPGKQIADYFDEIKLLQSQLKKKWTDEQVVYLVDNFLVFNGNKLERLFFGSE